MIWYIILIILIIIGLKIEITSSDNEYKFEVFWELSCVRISIFKITSKRVL